MSTSQSKGIDILTLNTQMVNNGTHDATSRSDTSASLYTAGGLAVAKNLYAGNISGGTTGVFQIVSTSGLSSAVITTNIVSSRVGNGFTGAIRFSARVDSNPFQITFSAPGLIVNNFADNTSLEGTAVGTTSDVGVVTTDTIFCKAFSDAGLPYFIMQVIPLQTFTVGLYTHTFGLTINGIIP